MKHLTIKSILSRATTELARDGIITPELDARVLMEAAIDKKTAYIFAHSEAPMTNADYARFRRYIRRRKKGEPVAYILDHKEFYGLDFVVNKNVLIPRPETELLVEESLDRIRNYELRIKANRHDRSIEKSIIRDSQFVILDIGTGSGCIAVSLVKSLNLKCTIHNTNFYATDISKKALAVAKKNAKKHGVSDLIKFYHSDLFSNPKLAKKFDIIIANLPYVPFYASTPGVEVQNGVDFEPKGAIFAGQKGTATIKRLLDESKNRINDHGLILVELDPRNANVLLKYAKKNFPQARIELRKDLANQNRYLKIAT